MRCLHEKVSEILSMVSFESIYDGFSPFPFALYDDNRVYFSSEIIPYDHRFLGNTCIEYNGQFVAIWRVSDPNAEDPEALAADLVHEMFHAFQCVHNENRYPSDLKLLDYPDNAENFGAKYHENRLLTRAFLAENIGDKRGLLSQFNAVRRYREGLIGDYADQEYRAETIEGMAEYAGCAALKQISEAKYAKKINEYIKTLQKLDTHFFDIRRIAYFTGTVLCITLAQAGIEFHHAIGATELPLFHLVAPSAFAAKPDAIDMAAMSAVFNRYLAAKMQRFDDFLSRHAKKTACNAVICGYDPMNMIKAGGDLLCDHFIMLKTRNDEDALFIQGPVIVHSKPGTINEVVSYIT